MKKEYWVDIDTSFVVVADNENKLAEFENKLADLIKQISVPDTTVYSTMVAWEERYQENF